MVTFLRTLGDPEVRLGYLNLTDDAKNTYGHHFPPHKTKFVVLDHNGSRSAAQMHNDNQVWGTLKEWYRSTGAEAGDTVVVVFDPAEQHDGQQVLHLGLFDGSGAIRPADGAPTSAVSLPELFYATPVAVDITEPTVPSRHLVQAYRILRDTALARWLKALHNFECQICGATIELRNGSRYAEAHHVRPLGAPHLGPDTADNILVLCPTHHAMCDLLAVRLARDTLRFVGDHRLANIHLEYHNRIAGFA